MSSPAPESENPKSRSKASRKNGEPEAAVQAQTILGFQIGLAVYLVLMLLGSAYLIYDIATESYSVLKGLFRVKDVSSTDPLLLILLAMAGGVLGGVVWGLDKLIKYTKNKKFDLVHVGDYILRPFIAASLGAVIFVLVASGLFKMDLQGTQTIVQNPAVASATSEPAETQVPAEPGATPDPSESDAPGEPEVADSSETESDEFSETESANAPGTESDSEESPFDRGDGYYVFGIGFLAGFGSYQVTKKLDQVIKVVFGQLTRDDLEK